MRNKQFLLLYLLLSSASSCTPNAVKQEKAQIPNPSPNANSVIEATGQPSPTPSVTELPPTATPMSLTSQPDVYSGWVTFTHQSGITFRIPPTAEVVAFATDPNVEDPKKKALYHPDLLVYDSRIKRADGMLRIRLVEPDDLPHIWNESYALFPSNYYLRQNSKVKRGEYLRWLTEKVQGGQRTIKAAFWNPLDEVALEWNGPGAAAYGIVTDFRYEESPKQVVIVEAHIIPEDVKRAEGLGIENLIASDYSLFILVTDSIRLSSRL